MKHLVALAHRYADMVPPKHERWRFYAGEIVRPLEKIANLSDQLADALANANMDGERIPYGVHVGLEYELMKLAFQGDCDLPNNVDRVRAYNDRVTTLGKAARLAIEEASKLRSGRGGLPSPPGHPWLYEFIVHLDEDVKRFGGKLSVDLRSGTLLDLLEELDKHLPSGFLPIDAPAKTYYRYLHRRQE
jgi:hypothetical protein